MTRDLETYAGLVALALLLGPVAVLWLSPRTATRLERWAAGPKRQYDPEWGVFARRQPPRD